MHSLQRRTAPSVGAQGQESQSPIPEESVAQSATPKKKQMVTVEPIGGNSSSSADAHEPDFARMPKASSESSADRISTVGEEGLDNADDLDCMAAFNLRLYGTLRSSEPPEKMLREMDRPLQAGQSFERAGLQSILQTLPVSGCSWASSS